MKMKKKKMYWKQTGAAILCFTLLWTQTVYAGNINSSEQTVINYYQRTFYYKGRNYVATEAAKASVYEKMVSDDVDLTDAQAKSAIRQASKNIAQGISEGYLLEADSEETQEPGEEEPRDNGDAEDGREPETGENEEDKKEPEAGGNQESGKELGTGGNQESGKEPETGGNEEDGKEPETGGNDGNSVPKPYKRIDVEQLLEKALQENSNAKVETGSHAETVTVEQYSEGKLAAFSKDGYLLFSGELPIKNTGYHTGNLKLAAGLFFVILIGSMLGAMGWIIAAKKRKKEYGTVEYEKE